MKRRTVRVAVNNNFNCTEKEFNQLNAYQKRYPQDHFFVNCNIFTPKLTNLNNHSYKAVITFNPDIHIKDKAYSILQDVSKDKVAFVRVKYIPKNDKITQTILGLAEDGYKVMITCQRYNGFKTLDKYSDRKDYYFSHNRMRLTDENMKVVDALAAKHPNIFICDRSETGCAGCGYCSTLTSGEDLEIYSLNLSSSGLCKFNCPDCFSKTMQHFVVACGHKPIKYDVIKKNHKQSGQTKHIKAHLKKVA